MPPGSGLEADFLAMLVAAGMPLPEGQVDLGGEDGWVGRVDFYYRDLKLVIEVDGDAWHTAYLDKISDERRDASLRAAGFEVERINIGASQQSRKWTLSFEGDKVDLSGKNFSGADVVVAGSTGG